MPHGIAQCYLPPGRGDIPALTPAEAGTRLSDPGGMQGWVDLVECIERKVTGRRRETVSRGSFTDETRRRSLADTSGRYFTIPPLSSYSAV